MVRLPPGVLSMWLALARFVSSRRIAAIRGDLLSCGGGTERSSCCSRASSLASRIISSLAVPSMDGSLAFMLEYIL